MCFRAQILLQSTYKHRYKYNLTGFKSVFVLFASYIPTGYKVFIE